MINFDKFELSNGLKVIVHSDKRTSIVAVNINYNVGSRDEDVQRTGFAHLFEHLMFGGSVNIPDYASSLEKAGGEYNAFTGTDFTNYYLTIPKNNLEVAFWLESDRMLNLAFSPKSLEVQRQVVIEEFKQNYLNQPYGDVYLLLKPLSFKKHPYRWNPIGKDISHIESATMPDVVAFYKKFYNPNNAILSVSGDVTTTEVKKLAEKWFGTIPRGKKIIHKYDKEPQQKKLRKKVVNRNVPHNALYMAWHMPDRLDPGYYHCDMISDILSLGNSSVLYQKLVKEKMIFSEISAYISGDFDEGLFIISAMLNEDTKMDDAISAILKEVDLFCSTPVDDVVLEKISNKNETQFTFSKLSEHSIALSLGYYELLGDANILNKELDTYNSVSSKDILNTAKYIFKHNNLNMLIYNKISN